MLTTHMDDPPTVSLFQYDQIDPVNARGGGRGPVRRSRPALAGVPLRPPPVFRAARSTAASVRARSADGGSGAAAARLSIPLTGSNSAAACRQAAQPSRCSPKRMVSSGSSAPSTHPAASGRPPLGQRSPGAIGRLPDRSNRRPLQPSAACRTSSSAVSTYLGRAVRGYEPGHASGADPVNVTGHRTSGYEAGPANGSMRAEISRQRIAGPPPQPGDGPLWVAGVRAGAGAPAKLTISFGPAGTAAAAAWPAFTLCLLVQLRHCSCASLP
jgi:hypothetical protein